MPAQRGAVGVVSVLLAAMNRRSGKGDEVANPGFLDSIEDALAR